MGSEQYIATLREQIVQNAYYLGGSAGMLSGRSSEPRVITAIAETTGELIARVVDGTHVIASSEWQAINASHGYLQGLAIALEELLKATSIEVAKRLELPITGSRVNTHHLTQHSKAKEGEATKESTGGVGPP